MMSGAMKLSTRRSLFRSLSRTAGVFYLDQLLSGIDLDVQFVNVAREANKKLYVIMAMLAIGKVERLAEKIGL